MLAFWVNKSTDIVPDIRLPPVHDAFKNNEDYHNKESGVQITKKILIPDG